MQLYRGLAMWKRLDSQDLGMNIVLLDYLKREFNDALNAGTIGDGVQVYMSENGFLFSAGAVAEFAILRGNILRGAHTVAEPTPEQKAEYTLVMTTQR